MDVTAYVVFAVPVIIAIVQLAKNTGLDSRWAPVSALVLGEIGAFGALAAHAYTPVPDVFHVATVGLIAGLTAAGVYSGAKATVTG